MFMIHEHPGSAAAETEDDHCYHYAATSTRRQPAPVTPLSSLFPLTTAVSVPVRGHCSFASLKPGFHGFK